MRRIAITLLAACALLLGSAAPADAATIATWTARLGSAGANGLATLRALDTGAGTLRLQASHLTAGAVYAVGIYRGSCTVTGTRIVVLPVQHADRGGRITRTFALTTKQTGAVLALPARLAVRIGSGAKQRCGVLAPALPGGAFGVGTTILVPHTSNDAIGMHWHTVVEAEVWDPPSGWDSSLEPGEVALAVHVRITAIQVTNYAPDHYAIEAPGGVDLPPRLGREPVLPFGTASAGTTVEGWVTFVVNEDELDQLVLVYSPASGVLIRIALS